MAIEWGNLGFVSSMSHAVLDTTGQPPSTVMIAGQPFQIRVSFSVPAPLTSLVGSSDTFRIRAFAESQGPGQEVQLGQIIVAGQNAQANYTATMDINPNPLLGEGQVFGGRAVSGLYKIVVVTQHLNDGVPTVHSGNSSSEPTVFFRAP